MKKFGVMPQETLLYGHIVPKNAIYGRIAFTYDRRIKTGEYFVTDKKGNRILDKKTGEFKTRNTYKTIPTKTGCVYSWEYFGYFKHPDAKLSLEIWILYDNAKKWQCVHLGATQFERLLQDFLLTKMQEWTANGYNFGVMSDKIRTHIIGQPHRKEVQKDYLYHGNPRSWALNPNYITDNIIIDTTKPKTNMNKLHPINDKPIYRPTKKAVKVEKTESHKRIIKDVYEDGTPFTVTI